MTARLAASLSAYWYQIDGRAALSGVDPLELPLDRVLSLTYHWLTDGADEDALQRFDLKLWRPLPGQEITSQDDLGIWSADSETAAFKQLAGAIKGDKID